MDNYDDLFNLDTLETEAIIVQEPKLLIQRNPTTLRRLPTDREALEDVYALAVELFYAMEKMRATNPDIYNHLCYHTQFVTSVQSMRAMTFFQIDAMLRQMSE